MAVGAIQVHFIAKGWIASLAFAMTVVVDFELVGLRRTDFFADWALWL